MATKKSSIRDVIGTRAWRDWVRRPNPENTRVLAREVEVFSHWTPEVFVIWKAAFEQMSETLHEWACTDLRVYKPRKDLIADLAWGFLELLVADWDDSLKQLKAELAKSQLVIGLESYRR